MQIREIKLGFEVHRGNIRRGISRSSSGTRREKNEKQRVCIGLFREKEREKAVERKRDRKKERE